MRYELNNALCKRLAAAIREKDSRWVSVQDIQAALAAEDVARPLRSIEGLLTWARENDAWLANAIGYALASEVVTLTEALRTYARGRFEVEELIRERWSYAAFCGHDEAVKKEAD